MSDSLRVRLEFRRFEGRDYRNSLFSFKKSKTKDVKTLESLIRDRFELRQPFCLNIDDFILQQTEPIEILRDNDLIIVEPIFIASETVIKTEPIVKQENNSTIAQLKCSKMKSLTHKKYKRKKSPKFISDSDDSSSCDLTTIDSKSKTEKKSKSNLSSEKLNLTHIEKKVIKRVVKNAKDMQNKSEVKIEIDSNESNAPQPWTASDFNLYSSRNTPVRKAFQLAANKNKPIIAPKTNPRRRGLTQEARDPVDEFSPIIILEKLFIASKPHSNHISFNGNQVMKKQTARKSFPTPSHTKKNVLSTDITVNQNHLNRLETIDCANCEPMTETPQIGDIIAFKMLTLSKDGNGYETSQFNKGSVLHVNHENSMIDILLENGIKRKNFNFNANSSEKIIPIQAIKINWFTVLEPKLIQRSSASK